jgi:hypothetical protein
MFVPPRPTREFLLGDDGMTTVEYVIGALAAAALAGILIMVAGSDNVMNKFADLIDRALSVH